MSHLIVSIPTNSLRGAPAGVTLPPAPTDHDTFVSPILARYRNEGWTPVGFTYVKGLLTGDFGGGGGTYDVLMVRNA